MTVDWQVPRAPFARIPVLSAVVALLALLAVTADASGYDRDELYFRMLPPAWGYTDQPPLMPLLQHAIAAQVDAVWAIRVPVIISAAVAVLVLAALARELGGGRFAQGTAAWGGGFSLWSLAVGHVALTASFDVLVWPLILLAAIRVHTRRDGRWWLLVGLVAGLSTYNKLLVVQLIAALVVALLLVGPRRAFRSRWLWLGAAVALVLAAPNLLYQVVNGFPQLAMAQALSAHLGSGSRIRTIPFLILLTGIAQTPVWFAALVALLRLPEWRLLRFVAVTALVVIAITLVSGGLWYYPYPVVLTLFAIGCVRAEARLTRGWRRMLTVGIALSAALNVAVALPILPASVLAKTPATLVNPLIGDTTAWPAFAHQIEAKTRGLHGSWVLMVDDYGIAGAIDRFAPGLRSRSYSGHNALWALRTPPANTDVVLGVGKRQRATLQPDFRECHQIGRLDAGSEPNIENGDPIVLCTGRTVPMRTLWAAQAHLN